LEHFGRFFRNISGRTVADRNCEAWRSVDQQLQLPKMQLVFHWPNLQQMVQNINHTLGKYLQLLTN
jgi:hypothetical protein